MGWNSNMQEPKRTNRWELLLEDDLRLACFGASIPKVSFEEVPIDRMHNTYKVSGSKVKYADITLKFYDFVDNHAGRALEAWHKQIYNIDTSLMGYPVEYKRNISLLLYGPDHSIVESWDLVGAWPSDFSRPELDWKSATGVIEVSVTLKIDEAKMVLS